ncbi:unnamed protein product [Paramecium octaurelia]|uniref:1-phosphatidylinositol 4-kinase n=1 Tax=Paramecium octaurelia TaxID=43137 RepID=A0A8S1YCA2_PAROT|nr:unnamed protein product [Paramecium octaurelia]
MSISSLNRKMNQLLNSILGKQEECIRLNILDLYNSVLDPEFDEYLFQLCYLFYVTDNKQIKELLYNYAFQNTAHFFRLEWMLKALNEDSKCVKVKSGFSTFLKQLETEFTSQYWNLAGKSQKTKLVNSPSIYKDKQDQIIFNLIEQSLRLKKIDIEKQKDHMKSFLMVINQMITSLRFSGQPEFCGLTIPLNCDNVDSFLIVNLLEDEFTCFNTAKRVPYKIIIETVNPSELELIQNINELSQNKLPQLIPIYDIEKEMKSISQVKIYQQYNIEELKKLALRKIDFQRMQNLQRQSKIAEKDVHVSRSSNSSIWGEDWNITKQKIKQNSLYGKLKTHEVRQIIIKGGDDLRSELLIMQMMRKINEIFKQKKYNLYLRPYDIILTSPNSGILEFIPNTVSIDKIKREHQGISLRKFYEMNFDNFQEAQKNFAESLAAYSLICYLFQLKDRHNGNILIDNQGHIIHIDFGFVLTLTPGNIGFESAPFKLISEYEELLNGKDSDMFMYYKVMIYSGLAILQENITELITFVKLINFSPNHNLLNCLENFSINEFKKRFYEDVDQKKLFEVADNLIKQSSNSVKTMLYDYFQFQSNTIYY